MKKTPGDKIMKKMAAIMIALLLGATTARAEPTSLYTRTGGDIGVSVSSYQYEEPGIMSLKGNKLGLDMQAAQALQDQQFVRGELRFAFGDVDYSSYGTGSATGDPDWYIEARGLFGKDWAVNDAVLAPYIGLGYRFLFNDGRGISCTVNKCYFGYRRESSYFYLPIGITHRMALDNGARLVSTLEYDHLLAGKQISRLSDGGQGDADLTNSQSGGHGLKWSILYEQDNWAFGPYAHFWKIGQSDWVRRYQNGLPVFDQGFPVYGGEPKNNTTEFGLKISQQF